MKHRSKQERQELQELVDAWNENYRTDLDLWEQLCWLLLDQSGHGREWETMPKSYRVLLAPSGPAHHLRQEWAARYLLPVYFQPRVRVGREIAYRVWRVHQDWERRLALLLDPDPRRLHAHWVATLRRFHALYLHEDRAEPRLTHCTLCRQQTVLPQSPKQALVDHAILPTGWHQESCLVRRLAHLITDARDEQAMLAVQAWHGTVARDPTTAPHLLAVFQQAIASDVVQRALASNPNCPTSTLEVLASRYPDAVVMNAVLPLLVLENPNWPPAWTALEALARQPDCPAAIIACYERRSKQEKHR